MLHKTQRSIAAGAAVALLAIVTGCGKASSSGTPAPGTGGGAVLPPTTGLAPGSGTCIPIAQQIPFSMTSAYFDWANIVVGRVPLTNQNVGNVVVGGTPVGGAYQRQGVYGTLSMNIVSNATGYNGTPYPGYPNGQATVPPNVYGQPGYQYPNTNGQGQIGAGNVANGSGLVQISPAAIQDIQQQVYSGNLRLDNTAPYVPAGYSPWMFGQPNTIGYNNGYNGGYGGNGSGYAYPNTQNICVSSIAINVGHYDTLLYGGAVYLYLNNTQHGYILYF